MRRWKLWWWWGASLFFIWSIFGYADEKTEQEEKRPQSKILSCETLSRLTYPTPYLVELKQENKWLIFYGSRHSRIPDDPMFSDIAQRFQAMQPDIAFNEGGERPILGSQDQAIREGGEAGFLRYIGNKHKIPVLNIEPSYREEYEFILSKYSVEEVLFLYFYRYAVSLHRHCGDTPPSDLDTRLTRYVQHLKTQRGFPIEFPRAPLAYVKALHKHYLGTEFDFSKVSGKYSYPIYTTTRFNLISCDLSQFRDRYITQRISHMFQKYDKIFIVMGSGHAVTQEPFWRDFFQHFTME